jgi:hypothetical protein
MPKMRVELKLEVMPKEKETQFKIAVYVTNLQTKFKIY